MTQVNSKEIIVYSDTASDVQFKFESANLKMEEGSAGSLTMKVPVGNVGYDYFEELSTQVIVRKDTVTSNPDKVYWVGRLLSMKIDFNNSKEMVFEGIFNYLMDTIQLPSKSECPLSNWVTFLLDRHNAICTSSGEHYKKVYKGTWDNAIDTVSHEFYTDYETTQEMINNAIQYDEAHVFFRYVWDSTNGCYNLYLDFKKNYDASGNVPVISFGQNLMDYSRSYEPDELATVIIPKGERYTDDEWAAATTGANPKEDSTAPSELDHYRTVWSCATTSDHTLHDYRVYTTNTEQLNRFGYVCKTMDFDGVRDPQTLYQLAQNYLANQKWITLTIEISAIDMKLLAPDLDIDNISIGRMIHCISTPHGLNYYYPCTGIDEDILDVSGSNYTLGTGDVKYLTDAARDTDDKLKELVRKNIERESILTTNILHKPVNLFTDIARAIDEVEVLSEEAIATVKTEAKSYALNLLNIFDAELNPNRKGYVHFLRENADYGQAAISIEMLRNRIAKYFSGNDIQNFFTYLTNAYNWSNHVITVILGKEDYQTAIYLQWNTNVTTNDTYPCILQSYYNFYVWGNGKQVDSCFVSYNTSNYYCWSNGDYRGYQYSTDPTPNDFQAMYNGCPYGNGFYPNKATIDKHGDWYYVYVNRNIKVSPSDHTIYYHKNLYVYTDDIPEVDRPKDHVYEIVISNTKDYMDTDPNNWCWRWNQYGLYALQGGYSASILPDGTYQDVNDRLRVALTYDGNIVADRITVGILNADVIKTGVIRSRPIGPDGQPSEPDGNMMIDIPNGNIIAKKGTLIFNNYREVTSSPEVSVVVPMNEFLYLSNIDCVNDQNVPVRMAVGGAEKNDWRIVSGSSFGVDSAGRVYMREGIIGATGGWFSVVASNTSYVTTLWPVGGTEYAWTVTFNTDSARPLFSGTSPEATIFRFRLAHYDANNEYVFVTKLYSFEFGIGTEPVTFANYPFYPVIEPDQDHTPPFATGELFPIWYVLNDSATEDYYEQDGHRYKMYPASGNRVVATSTSPNKYTTYSSVRSNSTGSNAGAVTIGSGYLSNGTFGQNQSFYLGGLKRSGTVAENTRTDWRFSVGSKFGVTENGNVYCTDMYARGAYLDRCTVNGRITVSSVTNLNLSSSNPVPGSSQTCKILWRINIDPTSRGDGMFGQNTDFYMMVASDSELSTPNVSPKFKFTFSIKEYQTIGGEEWDKQTGTFDFTYNKNGTSGLAQNILIDTRTWGTPDSGYTAKTSNDGDVILYVNVEMVTSETSTFKFIGGTQLKTYPTQVVQGAEGWTYVEGYVEVAKVTSDPRPAVQCGADFIGGSSKWLGGPEIPWGKVYATDYETVSSSSSSSLLYKEDITPIDTFYSDIFDRLKPVKYKFIKKKFDDGGKYHTGFIMEDVGDTLKQLGVNEDDFAAYNPDHEHGGGGLRYDEFIALTVNEVQRLKRRVSELEKQLYEEGIIDTDE